MYYDGNGSHGFLLSHGQYTTIDDPNGLNSVVTGINDRGQIVGSYGDSSGAVHGFLLSHGQYTTIDDPNAFSSTFVHGINDSGQIVGVYDDARGFGFSHGFTATPTQGSNMLLANGGTSGRSLPLVLPAAVAGSAALPDTQVINVAADSVANRANGLAGISTGRTRAAAAVPTALHGSGDSAGLRVHVVSAAVAAGHDTGLSGNDDVFDLTPSVGWRRLAKRLPGRD
jgi:hypothetical protein